MQLISCFVFASLALSSLAQSSSIEPSSLAVASTTDTALVPSSTPDQGEQDDKGSQRANGYLLARGAPLPAVIPIADRPAYPWQARTVPASAKIAGGKLPRTRPQRLATNKLAHLKQSAPIRPFDRRDNVTATEKVSTAKQGLAFAPSSMPESQRVAKSVCKREMQHCCGEVVTPETANAKGINVNPATPVKGAVAINCVPLSLVSESGCRGVSVCCAETIGFYAFGCSVQG